MGDNPSHEPSLTRGGEGPAQPWRLIQDGHKGACWNMAVDEAILEAVALGISPPTLRFYRWELPAITLGRFQNAERSVDLSACRRMGITLVRRPTGGRGVLHEGDETVSIVVPQWLLGVDGASVVRSYAALSRAFTTGLMRLGIEVQMGCGERRGTRAADCFALRSQADLVAADGAKVVGSAQCRRAGVILQQTSLRHVRGAVRPEDVFIGPLGPASYPLAGVQTALLRQALWEGFEEALGVTFRSGQLSSWECERAGTLTERGAASTLVDRQTAV